MRKLTFYFGSSLVGLSALIGIFHCIQTRGHLPALITDHFEQANPLARSSQPREAMALYQQYVAVVPWDFFGWFNLATMHEAVGEWEPAYDVWGEALRRRAPQKAMIHFQRGVCAFQVARMTEDPKREHWMHNAFQSFQLAKQNGANIHPDIQQFLERAPTAWKAGTNTP